MKHVTPDEILQQAATVQSAYPELQQHLPSDTRTQTNQKLSQVQSNNQSKTNEESTQRPAPKISPLMITSKPNSSSKNSLKITKAPKKSETNTKNLNSTPATVQPPNSKSSIPEKKLDPGKFIFKTAVKVDQLSSNSNQEHSDNSQPPSNSQPDNSTINSQPPSNSQPQSNSSALNEINSDNSQPQSDLATFSDNSTNNTQSPSNISTLNEINSENAQLSSHLTTFSDNSTNNSQPQPNSSTLHEIKSETTQPENSTNNLEPPSSLMTSLQDPISKDTSNEVKSIDSTELENADESALREVDQSIPDNHLITSIINQTAQSTHQQELQLVENQNDQETISNPIETIDHGIFTPNEIENPTEIIGEADNVITSTETDTIEFKTENDNEFESNNNVDDYNGFYSSDDDSIQLYPQDFEEEDYSQDESLPERTVTLPSMLEPKPLEKEKGQQEQTDISIDDIKTVYPFASYSDLDDLYTSDTRISIIDKSKIPKSYGITDQLAFVHQREINKVQYMFLKTSTRKYKSLANSMTIINNFSILESTRTGFTLFSTEQHQHSEFSYELVNATQLLADPLDPSRFFFFIKDKHVLYIILFTNAKFKQRLVSNDVNSFDVSSKYLVVESFDRKGFVSCYSRMEGSLYPIWEKQTNNIHSFYVSNSHYFEQTNDVVEVFSANNQTEKIQTMNHVYFFFKGSGSDPLFLLDNGVLIRDRTVYRFPRQILCAAANQHNLIVWYSTNEVPYLKAVQSEKVILPDRHALNKIKHKVVRQTSQYMDEFMDKIVQRQHLVQSIDTLHQKLSIEQNLFQQNLKSLNEKINSLMDLSIVEQCIGLINKKEYDKAFRMASSKMDKSEFIRFMASKEVDSFLRGNAKPSNEIVLLMNDVLNQIVNRIFDAVDSDHLWIVNRLLNVLLMMNNESRLQVIEAKKITVQEIINQHINEVLDESLKKDFSQLNDLMNSIHE